MVICVILTPFPFYKNIIFFFQADIVLIKVVLYLPNFSLMFLIHVFLYAGVYCSTEKSRVGLKMNLVCRNVP